MTKKAAARPAAGRSRRKSKKAGDGDDTDYKPSGVGASGRIAESSASAELKSKGGTSEQAISLTSSDEEEEDPAGADDGTPPPLVVKDGRVAISNNSEAQTVKLKKKVVQFKKDGFRLPIDDPDWASLAPGELLSYDLIDEILFDCAKNVIQLDFTTESEIQKQLRKLVGNSKKKTGPVMVVVPVVDAEILQQQIAAMQHELFSDKGYFSGAKPTFVQADGTKKSFCRTEFTPGGRRRLRSTAGSIDNAAEAAALKRVRIRYPAAGAKGVTITQADFKLLLSTHEFLNDSVIDFYIKWLQDQVLERFTPQLVRPPHIAAGRSLTEALLLLTSAPPLSCQVDQFYFFSSFFFTKLNTEVKSHGAKDKVRDTLAQIQVSPGTQTQIPASVFIMSWCPEFEFRVMHTVRQKVWLGWRQEHLVRHLDCHLPPISDPTQCGRPLTTNPRSPTHTPI